MTQCNLAQKVIFITGGSRGIGRSIALRAAKDGAKIVIASKTKEVNPKLPGTIYSVAEEIEKNGGKALPCVVDVRNESDVENAVNDTISKFGGIDILVNNASAISLTGTVKTPMKVYDLMMNINVRGTFLCSKLCIPHLKKSANPHILNLSPPLNMSPVWFKSHVAYTLSKYGMSMCALGMAQELKPFGIAVNTLWPKTAIDTAATKMIGGDSFSQHCRRPEIMSDAAYIILNKLSKDPKNTGNFFVDEDLLFENGIRDFKKYSINPDKSLVTDLFLDPPVESTVTDSPSPQTVNVKEIFNQIQKLLSADLVKTINASYLFKLSGSDPGKWFLNLKGDENGSGGSLGSVCDDDATDAANRFDCVFEMTSEKFIQMFQGEIIPSKAFMSGDLHIEGDVFAAMQLEKVMKQMRKS